MNLGLKQKLGVTVNLKVIRNGKIVNKLLNQKNLILDNGMRFLTEDSSDRFEEIINNFAYGSGSAANRTDSSSTTASQSGTTVTSNANFFDSGMVNDIIEWDTGETARISSFTSETQVEVVTSQTVPSGEFATWDVNRGSLETFIDRTDNSFESISFSQNASGVATWTAESDSPAVTGSHTVREIGIMFNQSGSIDSRVLLASPVAVQDGDVIRLERKLQVTYSPITPSSSNPTTGEGDFSGEFQVTNLVENPKILTPSVSSGNLSVNDLGGVIAATSAEIGSFGTFPTSDDVVAASTDKPASASRTASPTTEPWEVTYTFNFSTSRANKTIKGFAFGSSVNSTTVNAFAKFILTGTQDKTSLQTLEVKLKLTLEREFA